MTRLNFGCGNVAIEGYINIDCRPTNHTDLVMLAWESGSFPPGTIDEVYSRHMLEHLLLKDALRALQNWFFLLKPGGFLHVIVPDMTFHANQLLGNARNLSSDPKQNFEHAMAGFYGWHDPKRGGSVEDAHRWGYTEASLTQHLHETGFIEVVRCLVDMDSQPWHLNVGCSKPR